MTSTESRSDLFAADADDPAADQRLLEAARGGSDGAFSVLYTRYRAHAVSVARSELPPGDASSSEDVAELAFVRVFTALRNGKGPTDTLRYYLATAVRREAWRHQRRRRRHRQLAADYTSGEPIAYLADHDRTDLAIDEPLGSHLLLSQAFEGLSDRWRHILWLTEVEGRKPAEVASLIGLSTTSAAALAYRARQGLTKAYFSAYGRSGRPAACQQLSSRLGEYVAAGRVERGFADVVGHLEGCAGCRDTIRGVDFAAASLKGLAPFGLLTTGMWAKGLVAVGGAGTAVAGTAGAGAVGFAASGAGAGGAASGTSAVAIAALSVAGALAVGVVGIGVLGGFGAQEAPRAIGAPATTIGSPVGSSPSADPPVPGDEVPQDTTPAAVAVTDAPATPFDVTATTTSVAPPRATVPTTTTTVSATTEPPSGSSTTTTVASTVPTKAPETTTTTTTIPGTASVPSTTSTSTTSTSQPPAPPAPPATDSMAMRGRAVLEGSDVGVAGVTIWLIGTEQQSPRTTSTDADGRWSIDDLVAGTYEVIAIYDRTYRSAHGAEQWTSGVRYGVTLGYLQAIPGSIDVVDLHLSPR